MTVDYTTLFEPRRYHLQLERESDKHWIVTDRWNPDTVMMRSADRELCARFVLAFAEKEPGATADLFSWRVAQDATLPEREGVAAAGRVPRTSNHGSSSRSENVYYIRPHEQLDEVS